MEYPWIALICFGLAGLIETIRSGIRSREFTKLKKESKPYIREKLEGLAQLLELDANQTEHLMEQVDRDGAVFFYNRLEEIRYVPNELDKAKRIVLSDGIGGLLKKYRGRR